jgi:hypothetical protein
MVLVVEPLLHWVALADHCTSASSPLLIVAASNATAIEFGIVVVTPITVTLSLPIVNFSVCVVEHRRCDFASCV